MKIRISNRIFLYFILMMVGSGGFFFILFIPKPTGFYAFIALAAVAGFGVAANIWDSKRNNRELACPTGSDCNAVVNSHYSKFLGVHLEYWGMGYFGILIPTYVTLMFAPALFSSSMIWGVVVFSLLAGLFSLYLLFVQGILLRKWCIWCLLAAAMSLTVCVLSVVSIEAAPEFILRGLPILIFVQYLGYTFGVGGATAAVFLFANYLDDAQIDEKELSSLKGVLEMGWVGLILVLVSQFLLLIGFSLLGQIPAFIMQIIALLIAGISTAVMMVILSPFLVYVPFAQKGEKVVDSKKNNTSSSFNSLRAPIVICGAVIISSWYMALVASSFLSLSLTALVSTYVMILLLITSSFLYLTRPKK
ncbi:MAG: vitamin K epoxide reductase family protein [Candidatus Paceibacterota bacterium]